MKRKMLGSNRGLKSLLYLFQITLFSILISSCSSLGFKNTVITWNVELKDNEVPISDKCNPNKKLQSIKTTDKPIVVPASEDREARIQVIGLGCDNEKEAPIYEIPISRVKRITYLSDPLMPPQEMSITELEISQGCCRDRVGALVFDKLELRGAFGYRGANEKISYFLKDGTEQIYESKFISFDRGGSSMVFGFEFAGLWDLPFIDKNGNLQAGIIAGLMPTDEALFVPVGLHLRYTFNQKSSTNNNCNTWYLYGNLGFPFDFQTQSAFVGKNFDYQKYFYGFGIGYDWAITCALDFSVDLGLRIMNLPLPPCEACSQIPDDSKFPYRNSQVLWLRFGLTY